MNEQDLLLKILEKVTRIEAAIWPDEGQPSKLAEHESRIVSLEKGRSYMAGAIGALAAVLGLLGTLMGLKSK